MTLRQSKQNPKSQTTARRKHKRAYSGQITAAANQDFFQLIVDRISVCRPEAFGAYTALLAPSVPDPWNRNDAQKAISVTDTETLEYDFRGASPRVTLRGGAIRFAIDFSARFVGSSGGLDVTWASTISLDLSFSALDPKTDAYLPIATNIDIPVSSGPLQQVISWAAGIVLSKTLASSLTIPHLYTPKTLPLTLEIQPPALSSNAVLLTGLV
jgi:hypothetical protein